MGVQCTFYNLCFFLYFWLVPVFLQYLMRAPASFDSAPFYPVPIPTLNGDVPELSMSSFPQTTNRGINHCRRCKHGSEHKTGLYQWDVMLRVSYEDLLRQDRKKPVSTMYPMVFASNDAKNWQVVADADDVAGSGEVNLKGKEEPNHISAPLLVANLKNFGCVNGETGTTDPFFNHFENKGRAIFYKWKLVEHVAMHGSVNFVACVMQGMDPINRIIHRYVQNCITGGGGEMKCHYSPQEALGECFALGSACGQACNIFSPKSPVCQDDGMLDPALFQGLTKRRVKIKTSPGGGGAAQSLVDCAKDTCTKGLHFKNMYVEADNPLEFLAAQRDVQNKEKGIYYVLGFTLSEQHSQVHVFKVPKAKAKHHHLKHHLSHAHHVHHLHHTAHKDKEEEDEKSSKDDDEKEEKDKDDKDKKDGDDDDDDNDKETKETKETKDQDDDKDDKDNDDDKDDKKKDEKDDEKDDKEKEKEEDEEEEGEDDDSRTCVDLPGVRLGQIDGADLAAYVKKDSFSTPTQCTQLCGEEPECKQSIFSAENQGCYLFKIATVEVNDFSDGYNSSYCGASGDKMLMMTMLHQAYKGYSPESAPPASGSVAAAGPPPPVRVLSEIPSEDDARRLSGAASKKYFWQIAHVPNETMGMLRDTGSDSVRIIPRNESCFTAPGFVYMVACMTAKPVYMSGKTYNLAPPPFNDRCLAVGGLCGASCGSGAEVKDGVADQCLGGETARRLQGTPWSSAKIPRDMLVQRIEPRRSATQRSLAARCFFHLFIFFIAISYIATLLSKFPGNFTDFYPMHTWDEIRTHGYVLEKYGSAVACGCSAGENKMTVLRNWVGKISSRPQFDDSAFPTFGRWVDVFCDEGHREGARILWTAWTDFLDTNPPLDFLEQWSKNLTNLSWDQANERSPFDLKWPDGSKVKKVLPVTIDQASKFLKEPGEEVPEGGVELMPDSLAKLADLAEVYKLLPDSMKMEPSMGVIDDIILSRSVRLGLFEDDEDAACSRCWSVQFGNNWQKTLEQKIKERMEQLGLKNKEEYQQGLIVSDVSGKTISFFNHGSYSATQQQFPLHFREPPARKDRQVIMIYCARAKPETEREGIDKTRTLDKYLWACLRPSAVRHGRSLKRKPSKRSATSTSLGDKEELSAQGQERCWSSVTSTEVQKSVEGVLDRAHQKFLDGLTKDGSSRRGLSAEKHKEYALSYMKYRTVDSDWELARYCYGEIVGEEVDIDGDEALILDNPSPALLELISDMANGKDGKRPVMGIFSMEEQQGGWFGGGMKPSYAANPGLEFTFVNTDPSKKFSPDEFKKKLSQAAGNEDCRSLSVNQKNRDGEFFVEIAGPGKLIELIREKNPKNLQVGSFQGRMVDSHPTVLVKKSLLMPYCGVRGKSGGLNFSVDLLQFRDGFIGTGEEDDPTPERMLFGIFDARHQPHPDFWRHTLPKFMNNTDFGYTYEVNEQVCMVQAPQTFAQVSVEEDILDVLNGMTFNIMNVIRNRCGGVTSCGTNAVWQINAREFSRKEDDAVTQEYFDSRTKIEDTSSTHKQFCGGKRSVYVQEKISTGIAKLNSDYLCAMQRWAEGAVQLFWLQLFRDKTCQLVFFGLGVLTFLAMIFAAIYGPWTKELLGYNLFCDVNGEATLFTGTEHPACDNLYSLFGTFLFHTIDKVMFEMAVSSYMRLIDFAITWFMVCLLLAAFTVYLSWRGIMPKIVRVVIMMENISYWLTSCSIFFWVSLTLFMIIMMDPPLMFNVTHFMLFVLCMNITQHSMINEYKNMGGCDEASIWRSQQSYTLAAPLYVMAIVRGTASAWGIIWRRLDKSFWTSSDHGSDIVIGVTLWVTFIWVAFVLCVSFSLYLAVKGWILNQAGSNISKQCQIGALCMLGLLAITVWEPFLALWGINKSIDQTSKDKDARSVVRWFCGLIVWWRGRAWIMRYVIDFGMPMLVLSGALGGGVSLITLATYATTVHGFRG